MYHYQFPARGEQPPVDLFWYDGGLRPPRPECVEPSRELPQQGGSLIVGDEGAIQSGLWSGSPHIIPEEKRRQYKEPEPDDPAFRRTPSRLARRLQRRPARQFQLRIRPPG